jgi:protein-S-isoprenylcysteine O-methyltransferase Ste14
MRRWLTPAVFLALAAATGARAAHAVSVAASHGQARLDLLALYALLRTAIGLAFTFFVFERSEPHRHAREPRAFIACAAAMLAVAPVWSDAVHSSAAQLLVGDAIAVAACVWLLASVLALGRCFGVLPEARGLVTRGPYRLVRHPVYLGEIVALAGLTIAAPTPAQLAVLAVFVTAQAMRMGMEEQALHDAFPEYASYAARTPRVLPVGSPRGFALLGVTATVVAVFTIIAASADARRHGVSKHRHRSSIAAGLRSPTLQRPANDLGVQEMPAFEWSAVAHAASYQFQLSADPRFASVVQSSFVRRGSLATYNTAATIEKTVPDGVYYWRVRALTAKGAAGPWSSSRRLVKAWTSTPQLLGPDATTVDWPQQPLVFRWSTVPYAVKYLLTVATDPGLAHQVIGSATRPLETQGTVFTPSAPLTVGTYFWAVTPLDADGHRGARSEVGSFTYAWPSGTATSLVDLNPSDGVFDPQFNWAPVPGAARYEVEVNPAVGFPPGSRWCCTGTTIGASLAPLKVLANNAYYWRVRAIDPAGNAGTWNEWNGGMPFTKAFDALTPSIPNLTVRDTRGNALHAGSATSAPLVTWDPVAGASSYEVQIGGYNAGGHYCDWSLVGHEGYHANTATTAWTPLALTFFKPFPSAWPAAQHEPALPTGAEDAYCVRVLARSDDDAQRGQVTSEWTYLGGYGNPAFTFTSPAPGGPACPAAAPTYRLPAVGTITPRTPYFTWDPVPGAGSYYVVIARDQGFTQVADVGFTDVNAYAPRLWDSTPLSDETTAYYWAVVPATGANGAGVCSDPAHNDPQSFDKSSVPPTALQPVNGAVVSTQPTFYWTEAENARNYRLQVATDPSFSNLLEDVTTDATSFTSSSTYPANTVLYWRVRANDWIGQGLNWSATQTFRRVLPVPVPAPDNATGGEPIPALNWAAVDGAVGYEVQVDEVNGKTQDFSFPAAAFTPTAWYGVGVWRWQVRADFPTAAPGRTVPGGYSAPVRFVRTLDPPSGAAGVKTATRMVIGWNPDPAAKEYEVEIATNDGFATTVASARTANTSWAPTIKLTSLSTRGRLYWRVAAVDGIGNVGSFASGSFGKALPAKATCRRIARKVKGRRVVAKRCAANGHKTKHKRKGRRGHH